MSGELILCSSLSLLQNINSFRVILRDRVNHFDGARIKFNVLLCWSLKQKWVLLRKFTIISLTLLNCCMFDHLLTFSLIFLEFSFKLQFVFLFLQLFSPPWLDYFNFRNDVFLYNFYILGEELLILEWLLRRLILFFLDQVFII